MRARWLMAGTVTLAACFVPVSAGDDDGGVPAGLDGGLFGDAGETRCVATLQAGWVCASTLAGFCGGATCGVGQGCCLTKQECFVLDNPAACPVDGTVTQGMTPCSSNANCQPDEMCISDDWRVCIGPGHCLPMAATAYCGSAGTDRCVVCGCNGVTYDSVQQATIAGVRVAAEGAACGSTAVSTGAYGIACGLDSQCPAGNKCCQLNGRCFDSSEPWRCEFQPDGSILNCLSASECYGGSGGGSGSDTILCLGGTGCEPQNQPGICRNRPSTSSCGGDVQTVCGCNGTTYVNACWAAADGVRVADAGACP